MPRSVLLIINRGKEKVLAALDEVRTLITTHGTLAGEYDAFDGDITDANGADLIMVLGGDGTFLAQVERCLGLGLPMIGVNFGNLGFLAEFEIEHFRDQAKALLDDAQPLVTQPRFLLSTNVIDADGDARPRGERQLAMNDCVITAGPPYRLIELRLHINGVEGPILKGDGLIVSTPTGSTGYAVSAGGSVMSPGVDALAVTPIAAHSLAFRPLVVPGDTTLEVEVLRANRQDDGTGTTLVTDGQAMQPIDTGDRLVITRHPLPIVLVRNPKGSYLKTLMRKMHWASTPSS